jgi:hypothetical protein
MPGFAARKAAKVVTKKTKRRPKRLQQQIDQAVAGFVAWSMRRAATFRAPAHQVIATKEEYDHAAD